MASAAAGAAVSAGVFAAVPVVGWAVGIGAAVIDYYYVMPQLQGKKRQDAMSPRLLDTPIGSNQPGAPRVYALGARVRVPTHILWQASKVRESTAGSSKAGTQIQQRKVYFDAVVALNDRPTLAMRSLYGNGKQLIYSTRNIYGITSSRMVLSITAGPRIRLTALTTLDNDFANLFAVNDAVELRDWLQTAGVDINTGYFKVTAVVGHSTTPSYIELREYSGQSLAGIVATAGNAFAPATIRRVDSAVFVESFTGALAPTAFLAANATGYPAESIFQKRVDELVLRNATSPAWEGFPLVLWDTYGLLADYRRRNVNFPLNPLPLPVATNPMRVELAQDRGYTIGIFPSGFLPSAFFRSGTETQGEDALVVADKGSGNVPGYRGVAYQGLDQFFATQFGDSLPYSMEAVIDPDASMDWGRAIQTILVERCNFSPTAIDVSAITPRPFLGAYLRGPVPAITALQPILLAGQLMAQDRDGTLTFTEFGQADRVAIENGAALSHFGTRLDGDEAKDDKWAITDEAVEDLPTKIGVRHQDPDNQYADGYQFFGLRNPEGVEHTNEQEIDLSQMVLSRQESANLAATLLRRAWVNRRRFVFVLPANYLHLLESDLVEWTDDSGRVQLGRIIQRDVGSDFRVSVTCIAEDLDLAMGGSPVQSAAGQPPLQVGGASGIETVLVDCPAVLEGRNLRPGLQIAISHTGGPWAGAAIYESQDGTTWDLVDITAKRAKVGELVTALPTGKAVEWVTNGNLNPSAVSVDVTFPTYAGQQLQSRTLAELLGGANWCALIRPDGTVELAAFQSVTALGNNTYRLTTWGRGLRGTYTSAPYDLSGYPTCAEVPVGSRLVMLDADVIYREFPGEVTPNAVAYKIVPAGLSLDDVEAIQIVTPRRNAVPLPVRWVSKSIAAGTFDARFSVVGQWTRTIVPLGTVLPHPMDEPVESYRFTIYDAGGKRVVRQKTITASLTGTNTIRDRWVDYPASEQSADGYTPSAGTTFTIDVQQIGEHGVGPSIKGTI
jgi:hypothetical protein